MIGELVGCGLDLNSIHTDERLKLTGSYQDAAQHWDILIVEDDVPVAAIDFRTLLGSIANNLGNRVGEIIATAANFGRAYAGSEARLLKPFLGLVFALADDNSNTPRQAANVERLHGVFRRLVDDEMYDAICYLTTDPNVTVNEPDPTMGFAAFARTVTERITELRALRKQHKLGPAGTAWRLSHRGDLGEVLAAVASTEHGLSAVEAAVIKRRRELLARLRDIVGDENSLEAAVQEAIGKQYWIFGGQYVGILNRRNTMPLNQHDIVLMRTNGGLHIIELKRPGARLVAADRNRLIVSTAVSEAVNQCINYIRTFDEMGAALETLHRNDLGFDHDYRRVDATVLIGHPDHVKIKGVTRKMIDQTIRSYNAHLARVQVLTYADLIERAEGTLRFSEDELADD